MANILFLAHRLLYPPDKADKARSCHLLRHLAETLQPRRIASNFLAAMAMGRFVVAASPAGARA